VTAQLDRLVSYVPALLARWPTTRGAWAPAPDAERFDTAILWADISGFTSLTERLAERGPVGAEVLSAILNGFFEEIVEVIAAHGGEVVKFAGDATRAIWPPGDGEDSPALVRRAAQCGLVIQEVVAARPPAEGVRLQVRVGVGVGPLWAGSVGGVENRWEFLVAGAAVAEVAGAAAAVDPGHLVVTPAAWSLIADWCEGRPRSTGGVELVRVVDRLAPRAAPGAPQAPPAAAAALRAFLPRAVVERLDAGHTSWLAEFRRTTVVFVSIGGLDYDAPDVLERVHDLLRAMQSVVYRYDGSVVQLVADDRGTTLVAAWGVPSRTHEDDAARAVHAALDLQRDLASRGCASGIGVATGPVFCGERGGTRRREYAVLGDVVNIAARLMQTEGAAVLCDATTARSAGARLGFEQLPAITLKGKAEPVVVFRPRPQIPLARPTGGTTTLIGRGAERDRVIRRLAVLRERGVGGVVVLEGEPGIGKSSLVADVGAQAEALGLVCVSGAAEAVEQATPYFVWRQVFASLFEGERRDKAALRQEVLGRLRDSPTLVSWAPLLNAVLPLDLPHTDVSAQMTAAARADAMRELTVHLLRDAAARTPLLITLDDGHWFDSASWTVAAAVARRALPLLLVVTSRPLHEPAPADYASLLAAPGCERMVLAPLAEGDVLELVRQRLGVRALPPRVATVIRARAEGNPFFSEQLAYALRDNGHLIIEGETCRLAPHAAELGALNLPDTVQGVVASRIDRLTVQQQLTLKVASVIGRVFPYRTLRDVHPVDADRVALPGYLERLAHLALILVETPEPELSYLFKHVITQEVAYDLLSFGQRHQLHGAVARWYERHHAADLAPYLQLLAHHWTRADNPPAAIPYLAQAGEQALAHYANAEAVRFFTEAIALDARSNGAGDLVRRARWEWQLGRAHLQLSHNRRSRAHLVRSLALLGRPVPRTPWGMTASTVGQMARQVVHRVRPFGSRAASEHERAILVQAADIHHELSEIAYFSNDLGLLLYTTVHTLNLAEAAGVGGQLARAYATAGVATGAAGLHRAARFYCRRSLENAQRTGDLPARAFSQLACGVYYSGVAAWERLDDLLARSAELFERLGDHYRWELTLAQRAYMFLHRGQFARARGLLERAHASASPDGAVQSLLLSTAGLLVADLAESRSDASRVVELEALLARNTQRSEAVLGHGLLGLARLGEGDSGRARDAAARAAPLITRLPPPSFYTLRSVAGLAEVWLILWEGARGGSEAGTLRRRARAACRALRRFSWVFPIGRPRDWLCRGRYRLLAGNPRGAVRAWSRAIAVAERLGMPYEAGLAQLELGARPGAPDGARAEHCQRAATIFASLGAAADLERARRLSGAAGGAV